jgi:hypothetical protein
VQKGDVRLEIDTVWSGPDPKYRPDWLGAPGAEEDPVFDIAEIKGVKGAPPQPLLPGDKVGPLKYFFVRMFVKNVGSSPVQYLSWSGVEGKPDASAVLSDAEGRLGKLVSTATAPSPDRLSHTTIPPGEQIADVLVFEKAADKNGSLRLVLPYAAVGMTGQIGFELPGYMLGEMPADGLLAGSEAGGGEKADKDAAPSDGKAMSFEELRKAVEAKKPAEGAPAGEKPPEEGPAEPTPPPASAPPASP